MTIIFDEDPFEEFSLNMWTTTIRSVMERMAEENKNQWGKALADRVFVDCSSCGVGFYTKECFEKANNHYCSDKCKTAKVEPVDGTCIRCNSPFFGATKRRKYCSDTCRKMYSAEKKNVI